MKRIQILVLAAVLGSTGVATSQAGDRAVGGLIIGAGSGALIGEVAGHDTESILVGSVIGGAVGYAIGSGMEHPDRIVVHERRYRPVVHYYPPAYYHSRPIVPYYDYRYRGRYYDHNWRHDYRRHNSWHHDDRRHDRWHRDDDRRHDRWHRDDYRAPRHR